MSELNDFLKLIAEGKKTDPTAVKAKEIKENIKNDLGDLFTEMARIKEQDPVVIKAREHKQHIQEVVKNDLGSLFAELASLKKQAEEIIAPEVTPEPDPIIEDLVVEKIYTEPPTEPIPASEIHSKTEIDKYLTGKSFQQPNPPKVDPNVLAIQDKIKFLEQAIGKIAATGPGSGEVNFRYLDDVNRITMTDSNNNWVLEYDSASKKVKFTDDIGPIQKLRFNTSHIHDEVRTEGTLCWNSVDKTIDLTQNNIIQQIGQEIHVLVRNRTGSTITNGSFVRFAGAEENGVARLLISPFLGDGTYPNLFGLGIATEDIADDADGFVTTFGKVRELNTTNTGITSETWQVGDILYASPTTAGKLTKVKPTAPNNVIPVAAVLRIGTTNGEVFVRPTYEQKRTYGTFSDTTPQYVLDSALVDPEAVYPVTFNTTDVANGHSRGVNTSHIISTASGLFNYKFSIQFVSTNSSAKDVYIWFRKNGEDIPNSASRITINGNDVYSVAAWDITVSMDANDYFQIMWAATNTAVHIAAPTATAFCPAIPSVILTITEVAL